MKKPMRKRGRPPTASPKTAAERMRAYRKRKRDLGLKSVQRWQADDTGSAHQYSKHRILDARSLAMHCRIAQKISRDPQLLEKARANLERWRKQSEGTPARHLDEWQEILDRPWPEIAGLITEMSEEATRLRSSSPFAGMLSTAEREQIYAAFRS